VAATNPQHSSSAAQNATTPSENTPKPCAFRGNILTVAVKLREKGLSTSYLSTLIRVLNEIGSNVDLRRSSEVLTYIAEKNVKDSYKENMCDFYQHYANYYGIPFSSARWATMYLYTYV